MLKNIVWFQDYELYNRLEMAGTRVGKDAEKYRLEIVLNYFNKKQPEKSFKKPMDLWIACSDEASKYKIPVAMFLEAVVKEEIDKEPVLSRIEEFARQEESPAQIDSGNHKEPWHKRLGEFLDLNSKTKR